MEQGEFQQQPDNKLERWTYDGQLREYLLLYARKGEEGLESRNNFPQWMELSKGWHETMDQMEQETKDGYERWAFIGFRQDMQDIVLPRVFGQGTKGFLHAEVKSDVWENALQEAQKKTGIVGLVGSIHSHPNPLWHKTYNKIFGPLGIFAAGTGFSAGDLYFLSIDQSEDAMEALVQGKDRFMAFRTRESRNSQLSKDLSTQEDFVRYWYRKSGFRLVKDVPITAPIKISIEKINKKIAEGHSLVLYKGRSGEDLKRLYP